MTQDNLNIKLEDIFDKHEVYLSARLEQDILSLVEEEKEKDRYHWKELYNKIQCELVRQGLWEKIWKNIS